MMEHRSLRRASRLGGRKKERICTMCAMRHLPAIFLMLWLVPAHAASIEPSHIVPESAADPAWHACLAQAREIEHEQQLPEMMLAAVTTVESGRATPDGKAISPWPWTIFAEGHGQFFPTKAAAIAAVQELRAKGVQTIDVGCMQINLRYHPRAFTSLDEAFDPQSNVRYGAHFLQRLKRTHSVWDSALEHYHSYDPERRSTYRARIFAAWLKIQQTDQGFWMASDVPPRLPGESGNAAELSARAVPDPLLAPRQSMARWSHAVLLAADWSAPTEFIAAAPDLSAPTAPPPATPRVVIAINLTPRPGDLIAPRTRTAARREATMAVAVRGIDAPLPVGDH